MNKEYKEPMFKVVIASAQDVLTASYEPGTFEINPVDISSIPLD